MDDYEFIDEENIGETAFYGVASLTSVEMPNVKYIGVQAFAATGITYAKTITFKK